MGQTGAGKFFVAWLLIILGLFGLARTDAGKRVTYYALWLTITLLLVTHANDIITLLLPSGISFTLPLPNSAFGPPWNTNQPTAPTVPTPSFPPAGVITPATVQAIPMSGR